MQNDLAAKWQRVHQTFFFNEIETFAQEVNQLGKKYRIIQLNTWADALRQQAQNFDMENLPKTLAYFPEMLKQMQTLEECE